MEKHINYNNKYFETEYFCFWITAKNAIQNWKQKSGLSDFFTVKGIIKSLLTSINITSIEFSETENKETGIQQGIFADTLNLGTITKIDADILEKFDIKQDVVFVELNYKDVLSASLKQEIIFKEIAQHPAVERDLALIVDKKIKYSDLENPS